jgi:hypothetical protein
MKFHTAQRLHSFRMSLSANGNGQTVRATGGIESEGGNGRMMIRSKQGCALC